MRNYDEVCITSWYAQPNEVTKQEAANPPYTLAAEKAAGRNGQVNGKTGMSGLFENRKY